MSGIHELPWGQGMLVGATSIAFIFLILFKADYFTGFLVKGCIVIWNRVVSLLLTYDVGRSFPSQDRYPRQIPIIRPLSLQEHKLTEDWRMTA